jgi:hypothetical protein
VSSCLDTLKLEGGVRYLRIEVDEESAPLCSLLSYDRRGPTIQAALGLSATPFHDR